MYRIAKLLIESPRDHFYEPLDVNAQLRKVYDGDDHLVFRKADTPLHQCIRSFNHDVAILLLTASGENFKSPLNLELRGK